MTEPAVRSAGSPAASEISALIAWARRLSQAGARRANPAELAAFHHAKRDLLARIHPPAAPDDQPGDLR